MKWLWIPQFDRSITAMNVSMALFVLRLIVGIAFVFHGYPKILAPFTWMGPDAPFPGFLLALAALAEFGGGICLILGFLTPLISLALLVNMTVAILAVHLPMGDAFIGGYELPLVFFGIFIALFNLGPGLFSVDHLLFRSYGTNKVLHQRTVMSPS